MKRVYLDNAASTPLLPEVLQAMLPYLTEHYGNPSSVHHHGRQLRAAVEEARTTIAQLLNCTPSEIIFTSGGTEADNFALNGLLMGGQVRQVISSPLEHHAVLHTLQANAAKAGAKLVLLQPDELGNLSLDELEAHLAAQPCSLVALMHGNNEVGTLNDLQAIGTLCQHYGALFHSDTVQSMGHLPLDLFTLPVDFIAASAHKFYGPKGVGFLFRREGRTLPPLIHGGAQERNQRAGTENVAFIVGMAEALSHCITHMPSQRKHLRSLKDHAIASLQATVPGVAFNGETAEDKSLDTVLNVAFPGTDEESLLLFNLDLAGISASGGSACTSGSVNPSHVLTTLGHSPARMANSIRFSFGIQNTHQEIDYLVEKVGSFFLQPA